MPRQPRYSRPTVSRTIAEMRRSWRRAHRYGPFPRYLPRPLSNPITVSNPELKQGARLYRRFLGRAPVSTFRVKIPRPPKVGLAIGKVARLYYESDRNGKTRLYRHDFAKRSRPLLIASSDGKKLILLGGAYRFTERGITDK